MKEEINLQLRRIVHDAEKGKHCAYCNAAHVLIESRLGFKVTTHARGCVIAVLRHALEIPDTEYA